MERENRGAAVVLPLYALALFLSAALLFNVQPMMGKLLLPRVGGSPEVWNVAMAFFQLALLGGYLLAHGLGKLSPLRHGVAYLVVLGVAAVLLPIGLPEGWRPTGSPQLAILAVLLRTVALPFVALSLGAPTLQRLFSATAHEQARDPYFLYAASNAGSFFGLLLYPLVLEPWLAVPQQTAGWTAVYLLFAAVAAVAVVQVWRRPGIEIPELAIASGPAPSMRDRLGWLVLAAVPSSLTLGVTTHISTDIAATPLLWAITLGLYLLTFIVAFGQGGERLRAANLAAHPWLGALGVTLVLAPVLGSWGGLVVELVAFTSTALACHTLLSRRRPGAAHLTDFYLWLSIGGAIGGSFNAFVAPVVFSRQLEYPALLVIALALNPLRSEGPRQAAVMASVLGSVAGLVAVATGHATELTILAILGGIVLGSLLMLARWPLAIGPGGLLLVVGGFLLTDTGDRFVARNFFGIVRVRDVTSGDRTVREILHGTTVHGAQLVTPEVSTTPIGYYSEYSPIAAVFRSLKPERVAVIGLGSGGMNCFAHPGQRFRFYEIDPLVEQVARTYFTFLKDCPPPDVVIGDGRLLVASDPNTYDLLATDAFSSDSIPVHLLTTESLAMELQHLAPGGALVFHVSSRYFDLVPVLATNGSALGLSVAASATKPPPDQADVAFTSQWVAMARDPETLRPLLAEHGWHRVEAEPGRRPWTDDYSNPVQALKLRSGYAGAVQIED